MKSRESGFLPFTAALLEDARRQCCASKVDIRRDLKTIESRLEHEGLSFLTITLPEFCAAFDYALSQSQVDLSAFPGWKRRLRLPAFLRGFVCQVFDATTGGLLDEPSIECIKAVRQICLCFKKLKVPCSRKREIKAIEGYVKTEHYLQSFVPDPDESDTFSKVSDLLWGNMFGDFDHHSLCPRHGPGAVVEHYTSNKKYSNRHWHLRLEPFFPVDEYAFCNITHFLDEGEELVSIPEEQEPPVKVTLVPKTLKSPRIIAVEPCCMQYAQQALSSYLVKKIESSYFTSGHINFRDQSVNKELAISASLTGKLATLDMSEASDRVSLSVVSLMLRSCPDLLGALLSCRSKAARIPTGHVIALSKFASMGSAVCFPIEAMVFYTIIIASMLRAGKLPVTLRNIHRVSRSVYVYGDDIIIPVNVALDVTDSLSRMGNKVNSRKSFTQGFFRESCGYDAFKGNLVTPIYVRNPWPRDRRDASGLASAVATGNQFIEAGYLITAHYIKNIVERVSGPLPEVQSTSPGLGWHWPFSFPRSLCRFNRKYQVEQVLTWVPGPTYRPDRLDGWSALLKFFIRSECAPPSRSSKPMGIDKDHLRRTPRYGTASMKRRWITPY